MLNTPLSLLIESEARCEASPSVVDGAGALSTVDGAGALPAVSAA